jgi:hypothetical protein
MPYVIRHEDREWFKRCRRAWDFGYQERQGLEPIAHLERARGSGP